MGECRGGGQSLCHCIVVVDGHVDDVDGVVVVVVIGGHVDDAGDVGGPMCHHRRCWGWSSCALALVALLTTLMVGVVISGGHVNGVGGRGSSLSTEVVVVASMTLVVGCHRCHCRQHWWWGRHCPRIGGGRAVVIVVWSTALVVVVVVVVDVFAIIHGGVVVVTDGGHVDACSDMVIAIRKCW